MAGTMKCWRKERRFQDVKEESRKSVTLKRKETRAGSLLQRRPSEQDMLEKEEEENRSSPSAFVVPSTYSQIPQYSVVDGNSWWTPPATPDDLMLQPTDPWSSQTSRQVFSSFTRMTETPSPTRDFSSPTNSLQSDSDILCYDEKEVLNKLHSIKLFLFSAVSDLEAKSLEEFRSLINDPKNIDFDCIRSFINDEAFTSKLLKIIGYVQEPGMDMVWNKNHTNALHYSNTNIFNFSPAKSGFNFDPSPLKADFNFNQLKIETASPKMTSSQELEQQFKSSNFKFDNSCGRQDNQLICLALECIHAIIDEDMGEVFGSVDILANVVIRHILSIEERINRRVVQRSFEVLIVMIRKCYTMFPSGNDYNDKRKLMLSILAQCNLFEALEFASRVAVGGIDIARSNRTNPKDLEEIVDAILIILSDYINDMGMDLKSQEVVRRRSKRANDSIWDDEWAPTPVNINITVAFDKVKTIVILLRVFCCRTYQNKEDEPLVETIESFLKGFKKDMVAAYGTELNVLKPRDLVAAINIRKPKATMDIADVHEVKELGISLLPYFQQLLMRSRSEKNLLAAISFLNNLPTQLVVKQGLFYPLVDLITGQRPSVQEEVLLLLLKLVECGSNEILVLITTNFIENLIPEMVLCDNIHVSRAAARLLRKLFQRSLKFNQLSDWMTNVTVPNEATIHGHLAQHQLKVTVDIVQYMKRKMAECHGAPAVWYTWYWPDDKVFHEAEWISRVIYPEKSFEEHSVDMALADWDPVPEIEPQVNDRKSFIFSGPTVKPLSFECEW